MIRFIERSLIHTKGEFAGKPFLLTPWQKRDIVRPLFGTLRPDGLRQYRTMLVMMPRKNGKTQIAAALALVLLFADGEMGAEIYSAAADKEQARLVFGEAKRMLEASPVLHDKATVFRDAIEVPETGSVYRVLSADAPTKHGLNPHGVIGDELHAQRKRDLWDVLTTAQGTRRQPVSIAISTAGYDKHSILYELYTHAKQVAENPALDPTFLPVLYEAPMEADWTDEAVWRQANPALGDFRSLEEMRTYATVAKAIPAKENTFRQLYLNQWTEQAERWVSLTAWDACQRTIDRAALRGRRCYVGMDLSSTTDLTALVAVFPDADGFDVLCQFFVPKESIRHRSERDRVPYDLWSKQGVLTATPGSVVDYETVRATLKQWAAEFDLRDIGYDPWNATDLVTRLEQQDGFTCVAIRQGFASLSAPTKSLEKAILGKHLRHDGHPLLRWNISNIAVETDGAGNLKISKKVSTERIDGAAALIMAVDRMDRTSGLGDKQYQLIVIGAGRS